MQDLHELIQLLRKMGHDMRVPLNTLISTSDMLVGGVYDPLTARQEKAVVRMQRNSYRLLAMLDDFITYVKADTGDLPATIKSFDPRLRLAEWCNPIQAACQEKGVDFACVITEAVPTMLTSDEAFLKRIIQALLWNAVAHTVAGEIRLVLDQPSAQEWHINVKDSGSGITPDEIPHIFEPFWRGEARPQLATAGAGLGLPLALALTKTLGGKLSLQETSPQGSHFSVQFPINTTS